MKSREANGPDERVDGLGAQDREALGEAVHRSLPSYRLSWHAGADAAVWAVLDRPDGPAWQPRFTICRLDRCLVMMIEAGSSARQFCSAATMADALAVAGGIAREVMTPSAAAPSPAAWDAPALLQ